MAARKKASKRGGGAQRGAPRRVGPQTAAGVIRKIQKNRAAGIRNPRGSNQFLRDAGEATSS